MKRFRVGMVAFAAMVGMAAMVGTAEEIVVSLETNGILVAEGLEPGSLYSVEWTSSLDQPFTNGTPAFEGVADSNGLVRVEIPMFFRVASPMAWIPAGSFSMGDSKGEGYSDELPVHSVSVDGFYMDRTEVTKAQWDVVYNWAVTNGYSFDHAGSGKAPNHPVHWVNWYDVVKWCNARSEMEELTPCYTVGGSTYKTGQSAPDCNFEANGYRLPTEAEWEYAARGGLGSKRFPWGDTITHDEANYISDGSDSYDTSATHGYHPDFDEGGTPYTSPVGSFSSNGYGLYDMAGNLWEWCWDRFGSSYYASSPSSNPQGPSSGSLRVLRGGNWGGNASNCRTAIRNYYLPDYANYSLGFRVVLP